MNFPSGDVTYDNKESGLESQNVQGAIDELYGICTAVPAGDQIIATSNLEKDPYECRYFFTGRNPNNYIIFNNESWRIISVECDSTIKIMRNASIGNQYWDTSGNNNWARPASLNTYLNETYYNELNANAQSQIVAKDWSIGNITWYNNDLAKQINDENGTKWNGKIGLITVSEYIRSNSSKSECGSLSLNNENSNCLFQTWMFKNYYWWTLSPETGYSDTSSVFYVTSDGDFNRTISSYYNYAVYPTLYLSSDIKIARGTGNSLDPYQISL